MRVYLAGPEVFLKNAREVLASKKVVCQAYGILGVSPFDAEIRDIRNDRETGLRICQANEVLIDGCDAVIANTTPFRGQNVDVGTAIEIGYARARGKRIYAYTNTHETHVVRLTHRMYFGFTKMDGPLIREAFWHSSIDDFEMTDNLMVDGSVLGSGGKVIATPASSSEWPQQLIDLTGFRKCVADLSRSLANGRKSLDPGVSSDAGKAP